MFSEFDDSFEEVSNWFELEDEDDLCWGVVSKSKFFHDDQECIALAPNKPISVMFP